MQIITTEELKRLQDDLIETICNKYCENPGKVFDDVDLCKICRTCPVERILKIKTEVKA